MNRTLWILQFLLALLFLFAGGVKLILPIEALTQQLPLPGPFLRFIAVCEVLGALGLILPGLLRIRPGLTPLAAAGLVIIMVGAVWVNLTYAEATLALIPLVVGILAAFVAYSRWRVAPLHQGEIAADRTSRRRRSRNRRSLSLVTSASARA